MVGDEGQGAGPGPDAAAGDKVDVNEVKFEQEGLASDSETDDDERRTPEKEERSPIFETRLERATQYKEEGNQLFKLGEWASANVAYQKGLYHSEFDEMQYNFELMDPHRQEVDKVRVPLLLNAAACNLKLGNAKKTIEQCTEVLKFDKENVKAYFRRGQAFQHTKNLEKALSDFSTAAKKEPQDKLIRKALQEVAKGIREEDRKERALWEGKLELGSEHQTSSPMTASKRSSHSKEDQNLSSTVTKARLEQQVVNRGMCKRIMDFFFSLFVTVESKPKST